MNIVKEKYPKYIVTSQGILDFRIIENKKNNKLIPIFKNFHTFIKIIGKLYKLCSFFEEDADADDIEFQTSIIRLEIVGEDMFLFIELDDPYYGSPEYLVFE
jgi:hypothetical protein